MQHSAVLSGLWLFIICLISFLRDWWRISAELSVNILNNIVVFYFAGWNWDILYNDYLFCFYHGFRWKGALSRKATLPFSFFSSLYNVCHCFKKNKFAPLEANSFLCQPDIDWNTASNNQATIFSLSEGTFLEELLTKVVSLQQMVESGGAPIYLLTE